MTSRTLIPLAAAVALAAPATALADTVGSDFSRYDPSKSIDCTAPCTLGQAKIGFYTQLLPYNSIVTSFKAALSPDATARLQVLHANGDGTYTVIGQSEPVTGTGAPATYATHVGVSDTDSIAGLRLESGRVAAADDDPEALKTFEPALAPGQSAAPANAGYELMLSAEAEYDADRDGLGDKTEDNCVTNCTPSPMPSPTPDPGAPSDDGRDQLPDGFSIDRRALRRPGGFVRLYYANGSAGSFTGRIALKRGRGTLGTAKVSELNTLSSAFADVRARGAGGRLTAVAKVNGTTVKRTVKVIRGGAKGFDGTWRGGGFTATVRNGVVEDIAGDISVACTHSGRTRAYDYGTGFSFPALVKRDGSFSGTGLTSYDTARYAGRLGGRATLTMLHTEIYNGTATTWVDECRGATEVTLKR